LAGFLSDDADLIQRQPAFPQARHAPRELFDPVCEGGDRLSISRRATGLPGHQRCDRPCTRDAHEIVAVHLGHDVHDAPIDGVALTHQLAQLVEQHLEPVLRTHHLSVRSCRQEHNPIKAEGYDKFGSANAPDH
jgi:hypothetical protein